MLFSGGRAILLSVPLGSGNVAIRLPRSNSVRFLPVAVSKVRPCREPRDVASNLERYLTEREPTARYASFDYCYNYFQTYRERANVSAVAATANMELSCLHLGFYLASWGMLRGSTDLLQRSIKHLEPVVTAIAGAPPALWEIDANDYSDEVWATLGGFNADLCAILSGNASDTLTTKIMLGIFGCVPAFDTNFVRGAGVWKFSQTALRRVELFYREHAEVIERYRQPTLDFATNGNTHRKYTRAKVIDMIFFVEGAASS